MKRRIERRRLCLAVLVGAAACGGEPGASDAAAASRVERADSAGVEVLTWTPATLPAAALGVQAPPVIRVDPVGDGWALDGVTGVAARSDGAVVVANRGDGFLLWFGPDGTFLGRAGGEGEGPGEFTMLFGLEMRGDTAFALDFLPRRIAVFGPNRTFIRNVGLDPSTIRPVEFWPTDDGYLSAGLTIAGEVSAELRSAQRRAEVSRWGADGRHEGVVAELPGMEVWFRGDETDEGAVMIMVSPLVSHRNQQTYTGRWLVTGHSAEPALDVRRPDGTVVRRIRIPALERPTTDAAWQALVDARMAEAETPSARQIVRDLAAGPRPATLPAFGRMLADGETRVWLALPGDPGSASSTPPRWAVLDLESGDLEVVELPVGFTLRRITADRLLGVVRDAFDVESVVGYAR